MKDRYGVTVAMSDVLFPGDSELAALMRAKDWTATSLGPVERWPQGLKAAVRIVLTSRFPMWLGWGDDLAFLYNDAYRADTLGTKHPNALGSPTKQVWSEVWDVIESRLVSVLAGKGTWDEGLQLFLERFGFREETYHTFSYSPLYDDDGKVRGLLCVVSEDTPRLISERRVTLLGNMASQIAGAKTREGVLAGLERSLVREARDLPFTLTYLHDDEGALRLAAQTGFPPGDPLAVDQLDATSPWLVALDEGKPCEVPLAHAAWPPGPWQAAPTVAYALPLARQGEARSAGVFVAGVNPHRRFDGAFKEFISLFAGQLAAGLANADAYAQERRRAEMLAALDHAKTTFFSNVSHEFRTPLTLMLGPLGALLESDVSSPVRDELATIHRNALRLLKLVNTMLDFSRIEAGRATVNFEPVELSQLTADLASVFRAATEKAGLRLLVECPPLDTLVQVDRDMWEKIVLNLVSNAFKFTLAGEIEVRLARRGDLVELSVRDTGSGIPEDELPRVFERFHRVETIKGRTHEGTGIGLALVQELVRLHGGTVDVRSTVGVGSTFVVSIPIGDRPLAKSAAPLRADGARDAFVEEAMRWLPDEASAPVPVSMRERILVADDNADMRDYIRRILGQRWDIEAVANGREALAAMARQPPNLLVTDVMMPELDGFGLLAAVRASNALRDVPVIMLSARAGEEARIEGLQRGADDYLVKPFSSRELVAHVEAQLLRTAVRNVERENARRYARIFEQAPVSIAILRGPNHVFEIANSYYRRLAGRVDVLGRSVAEAIPEVVDQGFVALLDRVYQTGEPYIGRSTPVMLERGPDGTSEQTYIDFIYQPLYDDAGVVFGIAVIAHEVTALAIAQQQAESANRAKDEFLAMLGHELRNPLAPISTALQLMRLKSNVGAERERAVIERQVKHLVALVDDLLDVSRITRGKVELRLAPVALAEALARSIEVASPLFEEQRHQLDVDVPRDLFVMADASRLAQIITNLLTNAAKYTPPGGRIVVRGRAEEDRAVLSIVDTGIGIDPSMLETIFEPFIQTRQSIERSQGGLGLGLAIVANLVKLHGGTVHARSEGRGRGSELVVSLPRLAMPASATEQASAEPETQPHAKARVLVVDDNVDAADMLRDLLVSIGYDVELAHDGLSAIDVAEKFRPDVGILDIGLPVMDGFELAQSLRAKPHLSATKLVALTGYGQREDRAKTAEAGFAAHFVKPVDFDKLRALIEQLVTH